MLSTVITNIELIPDYYQKTTIPFRVFKYSAYKPYEDYLKQADNGVEIKDKIKEEEEETSEPSKKYPRLSM